MEPRAEAVEEPGWNRSRAPRERLPRSLLFLYGAPSFAGAAMLVPIYIHLPKFYSDVVGVPLGFLAIAIAAARALDALSDPLVGWLSDRSRSRFGRRRPFIALGAPLCALAFYALFAPPDCARRPRRVDLVHARASCSTSCSTRSTRCRTTRSGPS